jgi:hypothetical protein
LFPTSAGWCFARPASRRNAGSRRPRVPGAAQHEARRNGALQTRDRSSLWRSRISGAPLRIALALHRVRDTRWRRTAAARAGWSDTCIFLFFCGCGIFHPRSHDLKHTHTSSFPRRMSAPGVCDFASLTRIEGWAERRETFGCVRGTRWACHLASKTRVNALMTRDARLSALHRGVSFLRSFPRKRESSISRSPLSRGRAEGGLRHASLRIQDRL